MDEREASQIASELSESLYSPLLRYLTHSSGDLEVSEDVAQETFTHLYQQLRRGRHVENPKAWAFCVARSRSHGWKWRETLRALPASLLR